MSIRDKFQEALREKKKLEQTRAIKVAQLEEARKELKAKKLIFKEAGYKSIKDAKKRLEELESLMNEEIEE